MVFCFVQNFFFPDNTRVRIFIFFVAQSAIFFPEFNIRSYNKNSESNNFFFLHKNQNIFFIQQHWESEYFFRKKTITPPLQVKWSFPKERQFDWKILDSALIKSRPRYISVQKISTLFDALDEREIAR
jgi:hypothetical protein